MTSQLDISKLYTRTKMKRVIAVSSSELTNRFDENLMVKLRNEVEGKCNREGYIEKGSIEIIDHGTLDTEVIRYKGDVRVKVTFTGKVVNPIFGEIIECQIRRYNDFGIMANAGPLHIVIPFGDKKDTTFNIGQKIKVKVVESTLVLNDDHIDVYATFHDENSEIKNKPVEEDIIDTPNDDEAEDIESDEEEDIEETGNEVEDEYDETENEELEDEDLDESDEGEDEEDNLPDDDDNEDDDNDDDDDDDDDE